MRKRYKFVNAEQTNEERREKYHFVRNHGFSANIARWLRDWRWSKIKRFIQKATENAEKLNIEIGREKGREGERESTQNAHGE